MANYTKLIKAMQEFNSPKARLKRLKDKWSDATDICAIHIQMPMDAPAPDGSYEILFVTNAQADKMLKRGSSFGRQDKISVEMGAALVQMDDCSGGECEFEELKKILQINPDLSAQHPALDI